jgi:hypothetical protein
MYMYICGVVGSLSSTISVCCIFLCGWFYIDINNPIYI